MADYDFGSNPRTVAYTLTDATYQYMQRCIALGAFEGPLGDMKLTPDLVPLLHGIHAVLAGGKATVTIESRGNPDIFNELHRRTEAGMKDSNFVNKSAGHYVTTIL